MDTDFPSNLPPPKGHISRGPAVIHTHPYSSEDFDLAKRFAFHLRNQLKGFLKEVIFFGSGARGGAERVHESDIDVLIIVDDTTATLSNETVGAYRIITEKTAGQVSGRLHINTIRISAFYEYALNGDPLAVNIIRDGMPLLGAGLLEPFKALLQQGKIVPTKENMMVYLLRAPQTLMGSRWHVLQATIDLHWACLDALHALLNHLGYSPTSPLEAIQLMDVLLVKTKQLEKSHLATMKELYNLSEAIIARSKKDISGKEFDGFYQRANALILDVKKHMRESQSESYKGKL